MSSDATSAAAGLAALSVKELKEKSAPTTAGPAQQHLRAVRRRELRHSKRHAGGEGGTPEGRERIERT
jgi:hypothetical protein